MIECADALIELHSGARNTESGRYQIIKSLGLEDRKSEQTDTELGNQPCAHLPVMASMNDMVPRTEMTMTLASSSMATKNGELKTKLVKEQCRILT